MTRGSVHIHPEALKEAEAATDWYAERSRSVAEEFLKQLSQTIEQISNHPHQFSEFEFGTRRALLHKFPYVVVFRETSGSVVIIAVAHGRRRPAYWRKSGR